MEIPKLTNAQLTMTADEEGALWRKRFFEAQAGMERYLVETYGPDEIARWLSVRAEILSELDKSPPRLDDVKAWKDSFFRAQARLEKYLVEHHGLEDLEGWTRAIGEVFKFTEPNRGGGASEVALRFAKQAHCYGSEYEITHLRKESAQVRLHHCSIWDYREEARQRGVRLTLSSPCVYCTKATVSNMNARGFEATYELHERNGEHGCTWGITAMGG